ncbi:MAG: parallel beta-helix domain-containing protein [Chitinophagales bacterium]
MKKLSLLFVLATLLFACNTPSTEDPTANTETDKDYQTVLQEALINAEDGDVIEIPEGVYEFTSSILVDGVSNLTIKGAGMDKTILSFKNQTVGAEGLKVTADNIVMEDFAIYDAKGDAIKTQYCDGVTFRRLKIAWSGEPKPENGAYGLYPVESTNVLVEYCDVSGASDAGIYVGQSIGVIVRENYAHENVAGIEIENCINSDVYNNLAENNTGGLLVFDLPELPQTNGHTCRLYNNTLKDNNYKNFAPAGNMVAIVPPGSGITLLAAKNCEIFDNEITGHKTFGIGIASYFLTQNEYNDTIYDPYCSKINVYDNVIERKAAIPDLTTDFGKMVNYVFNGKPQDIIYDGIYNPANEDDASLPNVYSVCIGDNGEDVRWANVDAAHEFENVDTDIIKYTCTFEALPEVVLE